MGGAGIDLLLCILIMEMMKILYKNRWPIQWGLAEALTVLKNHKLTPPPMDKEQHFHDSFYLATHTVTQPSTPHTLILMMQPT